MQELDEKTVCNLCGGRDRIVVIDGRFGKIAKCRRCGLMFRITQIGSHPVEVAVGAERLLRQFERKQSIQLTDYEKCFPIIERHLRTPGRKLLEIGSHTGHFLDLARERGWEVKGIEPDENAARQSIESLGLDVDITYLRSAGLPDAEFDAVVLFHVIEHFLDPAAELAEICRCLRRGGILVAETPRFDTIWFKVLKERERSVLPDHFFYFSRRTLTEMVTRTGFSVLRLDSVGRTLALDRLLTNIAKVIGSNAASRLLVNVSDLLHLDRIVSHVNMGDMMRIYAQKN